VEVESPRKISHEPALESRRGRSDLARLHSNLGTISAGEIRWAGRSSSRAMRLVPCDQRLWRRPYTTTDPGGRRPVPTCSHQGIGGMDRGYPSPAVSACTALIQNCKITGRKRHSSCGLWGSGGAGDASIPRKAVRLRAQRTTHSATVRQRRARARRDAPACAGRPRGMYGLWVHYRKE
jgi:hypothetical protein